MTDEERQALLQKTLPLIWYMARKVSRLRALVDHRDLISAGFIGLLSAVDKFRPELRVPFHAYARLRIKGAMLDSLRAWRWGHRRGVKEFASLEDFSNTRAVLDMDDPRENPLRDLETEEIAAALKNAIRRLPPREREILRMHYFKGIAFVDIARKFGVTQGRVSQIHSAATATLRRIITSPRNPVKTLFKYR